MTYLALKQHLSMMVVGAALTACAPDLGLHDVSREADQSSISSLTNLTKSSFFDGEHMIRTFEPNELKGLSLNGDRFNLTLFDGISRAFKVTRVNVLKNAGVSWFGSVDEDKYSHFSITYRNNTAVGSALIEGISYTIRTSENGRIELSQLATHDTVHCEANHQHDAVKGAF